MMDDVAAQALRALSTQPLERHGCRLSLSRCEKSSLCVWGLIIASSPLVCHTWRRAEIGMGDGDLKDGAWQLIRMGQDAMLVRIIKDEAPQFFPRNGDVGKLQPEPSLVVQTAVDLEPLVGARGMKLELRRRLDRQK